MSEGHKFDNLGEKEMRQLLHAQELKIKQLEARIKEMENAKSGIFGKANNPRTR